MKDWLRDCLVDPVERQPLSFAGDRLVARNGANYPIVEGIPVLLRADLVIEWRSATSGRFVRSLLLAIRPLCRSGTAEQLARVALTFRI